MPPPGGNKVKYLQTLHKLTLLHSEWPKLYGVLIVLSATELKDIQTDSRNNGESHTTGKRQRTDLSEDLTIALLHHRARGSGPSVERDVPGLSQLN